MLEGSDAARFEAVSGMFHQAGFELDVKANIIEWLWIHHAINAGGIGAALWAGGIAQATRSRAALRLGVLAIRDAMGVLAARGVEVRKHRDTHGVLDTPIWLASVVACVSIRVTEKGRRLLRVSHFTDSPEEMRRFYFDVVYAGERLGVAMPHLLAMRERIVAGRAPRPE